MMARQDCLPPSQNMQALKWADEAKCVNIYLNLNFTISPSFFFFEWGKSFQNGARVVFQCTWSNRNRQAWRHSWIVSEDVLFEWNIIPNYNVTMVTRAPRLSENDTHFVAHARTASAIVRYRAKPAIGAQKLLDKFCTANLFFGCRLPIAKQKPFRGRSWQMWWKEGGLVPYH